MFSKILTKIHHPQEAKSLFIGVFCILLIAFNYANAERQDHPLIERYPGSEIDGANVKKLIEYPLATQVMIDDKLKGVKTIEGKLTHLEYRTSEEESILSVYRSYLKNLESAGFTVLFTCHAEKCGGDIESTLFLGTGREYDYSHVTSSRDKDKYYLAAQKTINDKDVYLVIMLSQITISSWPVWIIQDIIETDDFEEVKITVDTNFNEIEQNGKVVLSGLHFDTNKASLTKESMPALENIASYLESHEDDAFYVVGHTDTDGSYENNVRLSEARAQTIIKALVEQYKINTIRLTAVGVGPVSPLTTNENASGKSKNRRVELVLK